MTLPGWYGFGSAVQKFVQSGGAAEVKERTALLQKMVKQRKESAEIYTEQNRPELAETELAEAEVIEKYLPAQMSKEELEAVVAEIISQVGAIGPQDMGKVMGVATKQLAGKTEGKLISEMVKSLLTK